MFECVLCMLLCYLLLSLRSKSFLDDHIFKLQQRESEKIENMKYFTVIN